MSDIQSLNKMTVKLGNLYRSHQAVIDCADETPVLLEHWPEYERAILNGQKAARNALALVLLERFLLASDEAESLRTAEGGTVDDVEQTAQFLGLDGVVECFSCGHPFKPTPSTYASTYESTEIHICPGLSGRCQERIGVMK